LTFLIKNVHFLRILCSFFAHSHNEELRYACIQHFELSWKIITKILQEITLDYSFIASFFVLETLQKPLCMGDSGSPLFVKFQERWYLAGILSRYFNALSFGKISSQDICRKYKVHLFESTSNL